VVIGLILQKLLQLFKVIIAFGKPSQHNFCIFKKYPVSLCLRIIELLEKKLINSVKNNLNKTQK
jgi:hypothetical protein